MFVNGSTVFFEGSAAPRDLPSVPTRRSSDLRPTSWRSMARAGPQRRRRGRGPRRGRSEEHTSELQSLRHLVCRLLLEQKKYPILMRNPPPPPTTLTTDASSSRTYHSQYRRQC